MIKELEDLYNIIETIGINESQSKEFDYLENLSFDISEKDSINKDIREICSILCDSFLYHKIIIERIKDILPLDVLLGYKEIITNFQDMKKFVLETLKYLDEDKAEDLLDEGLKELKPWIKSGDYISPNELVTGEIVYFAIDLEKALNTKNPDCDFPRILTYVKTLALMRRSVEEDGIRLSHQINYNSSELSFFEQAQIRAKAYEALKNSSTLNQLSIVLRILFLILHSIVNKNYFPKKDQEDLIRIKLGLLKSINLENFETIIIECLRDIEHLEIYESEDTEFLSVHDIDYKLGNN